MTEHDDSPAVAAAPSDLTGEKLLENTAVLERLRQWAWHRGRTDVVGRLDAFAAARAFTGDPTMLRLLRLGELLPVRPRVAWVESAVGELSLGDAEPRALDALARNLSPWVAMLRWQVLADLEEMGSLR
ncbi:MAG TPA: hypothetical protein VMD59_21890 [Acidimicrobiales bacterium]|nr:hypothetical protein [Acidimicrobiales bacterium]